jgi:hypothetical protein
MARRKLTKTKGRISARHAFSKELEAFLAGDDAALTDHILLRDLAGELVFAECASDLHDLRLGPYERRRVELLKRRHEKQRAADDLKRYSEMARNCEVLNRFNILLKAGEDPASAFTQAIGPGPNSSVVNVPKDAAMSSCTHNERIRRPHDESEAG